MNPAARLRSRPSDRSRFRRPRLRGLCSSAACQQRAIRGPSKRSATSTAASASAALRPRRGGGVSRSCLVRAGYGVSRPACSRLEVTAGSWMGSGRGVARPPVGCAELFRRRLLAEVLGLGGLERRVVDRAGPEFDAPGGGDVFELGWAGWRSVRRGAFSGHSHSGLGEVARHGSGLSCDLKSCWGVGEIERSMAAQTPTRPRSACVCTRLARHVLLKS
jgi:hypothetical protein